MELEKTFEAINTNHISNEVEDFGRTKSSTPALSDEMCIKALDYMLF